MKEVNDREVMYNEAYKCPFFELGDGEIEAVEKELMNQGYEEHHTSYSKGYISRVATGTLRPYKGRFGEGYTIHTPCWESTNYHYVTYWIKG